MEEDFAWAEGLGEEWLRKQRQVDIYKKESTPRECAFRHRHLSPAFRLSAISSKFSSPISDYRVPILNTPVVHYILINSVSLYPPPATLKASLTDCHPFACPITHIPSETTFISRLNTSTPGVWKISCSPPVL